MTIREFKEIKALLKDIGNSKTRENMNILIDMITEIIKQHVPGYK